VHAITILNGYKFLPNWNEEIFFNIIFKNICVS
jgi:hypothetical protein